MLPIKPKLEKFKSKKISEEAYLFIILKSKTNQLKVIIGEYRYEYTTTSKPEGQSLKLSLLSAR